MTTAVVVDASVALARIRREHLWMDVDRRLRSWQSEGARLYVPAHFWLEISNALIRGHGMSGALVMEAVHRLDELALQTVELTRPLLLLAMDFAERQRLTMYDAAYLAIAESVGGLLFSADVDLVGAAGSRGVLPRTDPDHRLSERPAAYDTARPPTWPDYSGASAYLAKLRAEAARIA